MPKPLATATGAVGALYRLGALYALMASRERLAEGGRSAGECEVD